MRVTGWILGSLLAGTVLAKGSSNFHYRGLGDRVFAMIFRRIYGVEIERASTVSIEDDFLRQLDTARRQAASTPSARAKTAST